MSKLLLVFFVLTAFTSVAQELALCGENFSSSEGKAVFMIYRQQDDMPKMPFKTIIAEIKDGKAETLSALPYGDYAIILLHDKNQNGKVDHSFGFPAEPLGYSNDWTFSLFSGMPSFEKLKFTFSKGQQQETISITYKK